MIICIIAEGAYPYITGGVSSWIHQLISGLPNKEFKVLSIMPSKKEELEYRYTLPRNLIEVKTIYLDDYLHLQQRLTPKKLRLTNIEKEEILKFIYMDASVDWKACFEIIAREKKLGSTIDFLQSDFFWEAMVKLYQEKYEGESFNTFFWTIRTMFLPFIHLLQQESMIADVYHAVSTGYAGIIGVLFQIMQRKSFILTEHGIYAREREEEILKAKWVTGVYKKLWIDFFYFISTAAYREADKIVTLFERNRQIELNLGAPVDRTFIIPNGVDLMQYTTEKIDHSGYHVGAILRVVPIKDVMTLIRAFKIVKTHIDFTKLYLIGPTDEDEEYYHECENLIRLLGLENDVIFTGRVDVRTYLKMMDVIVLTSISEGQPLVILEGMAAGVPIVSTDVGSCRELLDKNAYEDACGFITSLVSPHETAGKIVRLLENGVLRKNMGANGRKRVERAYSREQFIEGYKKIYQELGWTKIWRALDLR